MELRKKIKYWSKLAVFNEPNGVRIQPNNALQIYRGHSDKLIDIQIKWIITTISYSEPLLPILRK